MDADNYYNPQLLQKHKSSRSFKHQMEKNQKLYVQKQQESLYADLSSIDEKIFQKVLQTVQVKSATGSKCKSDTKDIFIVYSCFQPQKISELTKVFMLLIQKYPEYDFLYTKHFRPDKPFYLMYVNSTQSSKSKNWAFFKSEVLQLLPLKYYLYLEKIVLVRPSFMDKASSLVNFSTINRFLREKCYNYSSVKEFFEDVGANQNEIFKMLPKRVQSQQSGMDSVYAMLPLICNLNQNRTSVEAHEKEGQLTQTLKRKEQQENEDKNDKKKRKKKTKTLEHYPTGELGIPLALELLLFYFTHEPSRCDTEGIFRKSSSIDDENELINELQRENYEILTQINNTIAVASATKKFLTALEPPLIPYQHYERLLEKHSVLDITQQIHTLPIINFLTLMHTVKFLKQFIIPRSKKNLMTLDNIAICLAPCFMRLKEISELDLKYAPISVRITKSIIENFQEIFGDGKQQKKIQRTTFKMYRENSKKMEENQSAIKNLPIQGTINQNLLARDLRTPSFGCPQDFLLPAKQLIDHCDNEKASENSHHSTSNKEPSKGVASINSSISKGSQKYLNPNENLQFLKKAKSEYEDSNGLKVKSVRFETKSVGDIKEESQLLEVPRERGSMGVKPRIFKSIERFRAPSSSSSKKQ